MVNISPAADTIAHHSSSISSNRVLLVDDEPDIARLFKLGLELNGIVVDTFNDPIVALSNYKAGVYNLLLLDLKMPKMNGFELYKKIKDKEDRNNRGVKVCFITAFEEYYREFQESFPNLEIDCFIRKPISIDELVKVVKTKLNS
jgi:two-component system, OmpR family, response regulator ChvI